ncbi:right-handed parallel beta-helix repeat-containing protein [Streptomyces sp. NPDC051362]|uniref:right-handed parallel beta-helix repeat-containing protein n=1 Tax=Streptomyces sp. NPDC051362 TaxID=3365651 RepID=UPI0037B94D72
MSTPVAQWLPGMAITSGRLQYMLERTLETQSVAAYGAVGDGSTDSAPAIQAALNAAKARGGGWVVVPPGTYRLATLPLRIYSDTRLTLLPGARFVRSTGATMILNGDAAQTAGGYTGNSRIVIEGGIWDMQGTAAGLTASAMCISIGHATDIVIRDVEVRDVPGYHAVELNSVKRGAVLNSRFLGYVDPGGRDFSEAIQIDLAKSVAEFGGFGPWDHTPCEDILVSGCYVGPSGTVGTTVWPRGVGSHAATIGRWHRRIRVVDCSFENVVQYAVSVYNWEDASVVGCNFHGCGSGVRLRSVILTDTEDTKDVNGVQTSASQSMKNITVTGCTFRAGGSYDEPIIALGETTGQILNVTVAANTIDNSSGSENGIRLQQVDRYSVTGNAIANTAGTGISVENTDRGTISGNQITYTGAHGITLVTCTLTTVTGNNVYQPGNNGILVQAGSDIQLRGNFIKAPGRAANALYYGIRLSTAASSISVSDNKCRPNGSAPEAINGFSATNTCNLVQRHGNDWRGATWTGAALDDLSTSPNTSATDVTA